MGKVWFANASSDVLARVTTTRRAETRHVELTLPSIDERRIWGAPMYKSKCVGCAGPEWDRNNCPSANEDPGNPRFFEVVPKGRPQPPPPRLFRFGCSRAPAKIHSQRYFRNHARRTRLNGILANEPVDLRSICAPRVALRVACLVPIFALVVVFDRPAWSVYRDLAPVE